MKYFLVVIILSFSLNSSGQSRENQIEIILLDCLTENYKNKGVNISKELDKLENYLVKNKFLKSSSGQSYYDFYKKIVKLGDIPAIIDYNSLEGIYRLSPSQFYTMECFEQLKGIDSTVIAKSKYYQLKINMEQSSAGGISPSGIASAIINTLSPSNFEMPYYRAVALLAIAYTSNSDEENVIFIKSNEDQDYSNYKRIFVVTNGKNELFIDGRAINEEEFKKMITHFIRKNKSNHLIEFKADRDTPYAFYLKIKDLISGIYNDLREELAMEKFKKKYDELMASKQKKIIKTYPIQVKE